MIKLVNDKLSDIKDNSKLTIFKHVKINNTEEKYFICSKLEFRKLITKFRLSDHNLLIEKGRYLKIPNEEI